MENSDNLLKNILKMKIVKIIFIWCKNEIIN